MFWRHSIFDTKLEYINSNNIKVVVAFSINVAALSTKVGMRKNQIVVQQ